MLKMIGLIVLVPALAAADSWKLGTESWEIHGCASPRAAHVLADFVGRDPTFVVTDTGALLVESMPVDKHGKIVSKDSHDRVGVKETSWRADAVIETGKAHWSMPRNAETNQQINILVDVSPFAVRPDGTQTIKVQLVVDYDPLGTGTHQNVCAETWSGAAVKL